MATRSNHHRLWLPAAGMTVAVILAVGAIFVMDWSRARPQAAAAAPIAEAPGEPMQFAEAQTSAPKQHKQTPQAQAPKPAQIDRNGVLILIRSALLALDQANKTGNYTVLRDLGSPEFQVNSAAQLADIFAKERHDNIDLSGVAVIDPQLTLLPQIESNGMMHMAGFFPSVPTQVNFELLYAPVNRQWRLFALAVSFGQAAPVAPPPPAAPPAHQPAGQPRAEPPLAHAPPLGGRKTNKEAHATPPAAAPKATSETKQ
jgi:hypothetical protein